MTSSPEVQEKVPEQKSSPQTSATIKTKLEPDAPICLVCGLELRPRFAKVLDAKTLEIFSILECPQCGLGCTIPKPSDLAKYYGDYHGGRHGITNTFCTNRRIRILQKLTLNSNGK